MKSIRKQLRVIQFILLGMFAILMIYFVYAIQTYSGRWFSNPYNVRLRQQKNNVIAGKILDRNRTELAYSDTEGKRHYNENESVRKALSHVIGDSVGLTSNGVESFQARYLLGFNENVFERIYKQLTSQNRIGDDILLTLDADISRKAMQAMGNYNGSVVLLNYKTGEILAMVSKPGFDPEHIENYRNTTTDNSILVNRSTMGRYAPGSVFKIITASAALRYIPDIESRTWNCSGPMVFDYKNEVYLPNVHFSQEDDQLFRNEQEAKRTKESDPSNDENLISSGNNMGNYKLLRDYQSKYHGEISLKRAFAVSCNHTFAQIALEIGPEKMEKMAKDFGFDVNFLFSDLSLYTSSFEQGKTDYYNGWSAVGQFHDLVTPLHMAMISASIANNGEMMEPKLVRGILNSRELISKSLSPKVFRVPLRKAETDLLKEYMRLTIQEGTGKSAAISGYQVCGKTGTAEVSSDKNVGNNAWFTGFIEDEDHPLAISVVLEGAGSGGGKAAPVAGQILKDAVKKGY